MTRWGKSRFLCVMRIVSCIYDSHCCSCKDLLGGTPCREVLPAKKKLCREVLPVAATARSTVPSSHCDAATTPGRATARRVGPHCAREGFCPCRRLARRSEPTQGRSLYHQSPRSISRPCSPSPPQQHRRRCGGPISRGPQPWNISVRKQVGIPEYWELLPAESYSLQIATSVTPASRHAWRQNCSHE